MNSLITKSIKGTQSYLIVAAVFSGAINILMLAGSMFMLQVYDRVIPSHSFETLLALVLLVVCPSSKKMGQVGFGNNGEIGLI